MNILLSSVGRRSYLVNYFQEALGTDGLVVVTNSIPDTQGILVSEKSYVVPEASNPEYLDTLIDICKCNKIQMLFSLHDLDAYILSQHKGRFFGIGVIPVISDYSVMKYTLDKYKTSIWAKKNGIGYPKTFLTCEDALLSVEKGEISFPLIVKPIHGFGSIEVSVAHDEEELFMLVRLVDKNWSRSNISSFVNCEMGSVIVQELLNGQEFGLDIVNDLEGEYVTCFVKRKLGMRSGETDGAVTEDNVEIKEFGALISRKLRHIGLLDADVFLDEDGSILLLELNPRFGGGYPFSHVAGADIPRFLLALATQADVNARWLQVEPGVRSFKDISILRMKQ